MIGKTEAMVAKLLNPRCKICGSIAHDYCLVVSTTAEEFDAEILREIERSKLMLDGRVKRDV